MIRQPNLPLTPPVPLKATVQEWASDMVFMDYQQLKEQASDLSP